MDEQALLEAMRAMIKEELGPVNTRLDTIDTRLDTVDTRLDTFDTRFDTINTRLDNLEQGQAELRQDVRRLNGSVTVLEKTVNSHMTVIREGLEGFAERGPQINRLEEKYDEHDHRIWALEQAVKK